VASRGRGPPPEPSECKFGQALELGATDAEMTRNLEVKNERLTTIDLVKPLAHFSLLVHLDISMNKISAVEGGFENCANLRTVIISDNLLREISPFMFAKCKQIRSVNLDIN